MMDPSAFRNNRPLLGRNESNNMKRRDFIKTSLAAGSLLGMGQVANAATTVPKTKGRTPEYYEWRTYLLKTPAQKDRVDEYFKQAFIPALNRLGCKPIGVFTEQNTKEITKLYALITYPSLEVFGSVTARLAKDEAYQKAGANYLQATKADPAYARIESSFMVAFTGMPRIELAPFSTEKKPRMFEIRIYEAHSEVKCQKKVEMFNIGEMQVMRETGLAPVFYGYTLLGAKVPNMTYMLSAENQDEHKKHWATFGAHPEWTRLKGLPEYADTVSNITNIFLVPTTASQI